MASNGLHPHTRQVSRVPIGGERETPQRNRRCEPTMSEEPSLNTTALAQGTVRDG
jgi:hypothetical protein